MKSILRMPSWWLCAVILLITVLLTGSVWSAPVSTQTVQSAVTSWVQEVTSGARPNAAVERLEPHVVNGRVTAYIAHLVGGGFCLCGGDDLALPVYLYQPSGTYDGSVPTHQFILKEISDRIITLQMELDSGITLHQGALAERKSLWADLSAGRMESARAASVGLATPTSLQLPVNTLWDQGYPYNDSCPIGGHSGQRTITGCVATAGAQVMKYWAWPNTGTGAHSYYYQYRWADSCVYKYYYPNSYGPPVIPNNSFWNAHLTYSNNKLAACGCWDESVRSEATDFTGDWDYRVAIWDLYDAMHKDSVVIWRIYDATSYNWSLMRETHPATAAGDAEVAKLMMDIGAAAQLTYGMLSTSGYIGIESQYTRDLYSALRDNFRYDTDIQYDTGRYAGTVDSIITELQWSRPTLLSGHGDLGGHAWVAVGYNTATYPTTFLMNYGWSGGSNGWYTLDTCGFPDRLDRLTFIAPNSGVKFVGSASAGDGSPKTPMNTLATALSTVPNGTTLVLKAGTTHTLAAGTLTKPIRIRGYQITLLKQ